MKLLSISALGLALIAITAGCCHQTTACSASDGKTTVTQTTQTTYVNRNVPSPNPTPYGGLPAFVGTHMAPGQ